MKIQRESRTGLITGLGQPCDILANSLAASCLCPWHFTRVEFKVIRLTWEENFKREGHSGCGATTFTVFV